MTLSTITIISLLLALYGLVSIIRDIVRGVKNVLERRAIDKAFKEFSSKINLESARATAAFYLGDDFGAISSGDLVSGVCNKPKRKYNKSGKHKKVTKKTK